MEVEHLPAKAPKRVAIGEMGTPMMGPGMTLETDIVGSYPVGVPPTFAPRLVIKTGTLHIWW